MDLKQKFKDDIWCIINEKSQLPEDFFKIIIKYLSGQTLDEIKKTAQELTKKYYSILTRLDITDVNKDIIQIIKEAEDEYDKNVQPILNRIEKSNGKNYNKEITKIS